MVPSLYSGDLTLAPSLLLSFHWQYWPCMYWIMYSLSPGLKSKLLNRNHFLFIFSNQILTKALALCGQLKCLLNEWMSEHMNECLLNHLLIKVFLVKTKQGSLSSIQTLGGLAFFLFLTIHIVCVRETLSKNKWKLIQFMIKWIFSFS